MQYWWNAFALDSRRPTITARNSSAKIEPSDDFTEVNVLNHQKTYKFYNSFLCRPIYWR